MILTWFPFFVDKANLPIPIARIQLKYHTAGIKVRLLWLVLTGCKPEVNGNVQTYSAQTHTYSSSFARMKKIEGKSLISDILLNIIFKRGLNVFCALNALNLIHGLGLLSGIPDHQHTVSRNAGEDGMRKMN